MSTFAQSDERPRTEPAITDEHDTEPDHPVSPFVLPENAADLVDWFDVDLIRLCDRSLGSNRYTKGRSYEKTDHGWLQIHDAYEPVTATWRDSQRAVANAWNRLEYPIRNANSNGRTRIECSANFRATHHADGSGVLMHYSTTEAWRTRSLLVINNADCWAAGFAHCTPPSVSTTTARGNDGTDVTLSRTLVQRVLSEGPTRDDAASLVEEHAHPDRSLRVFSLESGGALAFWTDHTARAERCATVFAPAVAQRHAPDYATLLDELKPDEVRVAEANGYPVRDADEAGDDPDIPGGYTLRQGEWFFVPTTTDFEPDAEIDPDRWTADFLGNHRPRDLGIVERDGDSQPYVRGWVSHPRDHERAYLGEMWHRAIDSPTDNVLVLDADEASSRGRRSRHRSRARFD